MLSTSRRDLILSAAVAGAVLGLEKSLAIVAPVEGQQAPAAPVRSQHKPTASVRRAQTPDPKPGFLRYEVGDAEITALYDGIWEKVHNPAFFSNATVAETKQALADAAHHCIRADSNHGVRHQVERQACSLRRRRRRPDPGLQPKFGFRFRAR
jgi:hypothetical protein